MKKAFILLVCLGIIGCATVPALNNVSLGMTKAEVVKVLGAPSSVSAKDNTEYLKYEDHSFATNWRRQNEQEKGFYTSTPEFFVRLVNGKVESYGKVGDFDSAKNPANDINLNIKNEGK
ncbi:MAG: hypothetical protein WCH62_08535 [Candidatus Omnitrophota bacterium]